MAQDATLLGLGRSDTSPISLVFIWHLDCGDLSSFETSRQDRGFIIIILFSFSSSPLSSLDMKSVIGTFDHFSLS